MKVKLAVLGSETKTDSFGKTVSFGCRWMKKGVSFAKTGSFGKKAKTGSFGCRWTALKTSWKQLRAREADSFVFALTVVTE